VTAQRIPILITQRPGEVNGRKGENDPGVGALEDHRKKAGKPHQRKEKHTYKRKTENNEKTKLKGK